MTMQRFFHSASLLLIVVLATGPAPAAGQETAPDMVREPSSGTPFPVLLTPPGGTTRHWFAGTGIRQRTIFRVKIYAFGLYVDPTGARAALSGFAGIPAAARRSSSRAIRRAAWQPPWAATNDLPSTRGPSAGRCSTSIWAKTRSPATASAV